MKSINVIDFSIEGIYRHSSWYVYRLSAKESTLTNTLIYHYAIIITYHHKLSNAPS